jgi:hypothetical protein
LDQRRPPRRCTRCTAGCAVRPCCHCTLWLQAARWLLRALGAKCQQFGITAQTRSAKWHAMARTYIVGQVTAQTVGTRHTRTTRASCTSVKSHAPSVRRHAPTVRSALRHLHAQPTQSHSMRTTGTSNQQASIMHKGMVSRVWVHRHWRGTVSTAATTVRQSQ